MSYYLNPFDSEFRGNLVLSDRQHSLSFNVRAARNSSLAMASGNYQPYDVSTNKTLTINYTFDSGHIWNPLAIDISTLASSASAATAQEIVNALIANAVFASLFNASVKEDRSGRKYILIQSIKDRGDFKVYISLTGAEIPLRFNKNAGVSELPDFFARHTIENRATFPDSQGMLIALNETTAQDQAILQDAGFTYAVDLTNGSDTVTIKNTSIFAVGDSVEVFNGSTSETHTIDGITANTSVSLDSSWAGSTGSGSIIINHADYQMLRGRSGLFTFQNLTVDASSRITQIIEYAAGAAVGDFARKIIYSYTGAKTSPDKIVEIPYTLTSSDLVTP